MTCLSRSALVNIRRKALLSSVGFRKRMTPRSPRGIIMTAFCAFASISTLICLMIWLFVSRSCLAFSIIPRLIQPRRCHCIRLEMMFKCFASIKPLSASGRSFQWMLLSNIPWMAPDGMAFKKNNTNKQIKLKWTAAPSNNFFKILAGIIENHPYGNVCLCRIIILWMLATTTRTTTLFQYPALIYMIQKKYT